MTKDEASRLALEALEDYQEHIHRKKTQSAITAIKAALEAKDEPVAEVTSETGADITMSWWHEPALPVGTKLYTTPPQRTWVGLTDEEIEKHWKKQVGTVRPNYSFTRAIEAKLKEKNT
jgi:hypothetical protein